MICSYLSTAQLHALSLFRTSPELARLSRHRRGLAALMASSSVHLLRSAFEEISNPSRRSPGRGLAHYFISADILLHTPNCHPTRQNVQPASPPNRTGFVKLPHRHNPVEKQFISLQLKKNTANTPHQASASPSPPASNQKFSSPTSAPSSHGSTSP